MELIDKAAVKAEIEKRIEEGEKVAKELPSSAIMGLIQAYKNTLSFLDTLEVKEVELDAECRKYLTEHFNVYEDGILQSKCSGMPLDTFDVIQVASHFFELGLKAKVK